MDVLRVKVNNEWVDIPALVGPQGESGNDQNAVHFNESQNLTEAQKNTARNNIGAASTGDITTILANFAGAFVQANAYSAGTYVTYTDGFMYVLPDGHEADVTWVNTTKTKVSVGGELSELNKIDILNRLAPQIYNKKIACLGDSFTYGVATYVSKLNDRYLSHAINYGVASSRIVLDTTSGGTTIASFLNRYSAMDNDADIITVFGGINDAYDLGSGALSLGTIESALDTTTFYGGLKLLVTNLMKKYPDKQIIGIVPPDCQIGAYYIANLPAVQNAEREVYNMYGIPIIDLKRECYKMSTLPEMVALYRAASDSIHPSGAGQEALCDTISAGIRRIIP